jgi:tetratricopeptide (TPR) repeat protein
VDVAVVRAAADFYASQHDMTKAQEVLRRLDQMPQLRPGVRESVLAQFNDEWGDRKTAAAQYAAAARAGGTDSALWQQLVAFHVRGGDYAAAEAAGAQAVQAMPNDSQLAALRQQVQGMVARGNYGELQLINDVIAHSPSDATALETLRLLDEARKSNESADVTVLKLRQLADTQPRFLPLQLLLIQRYLVMDRPNDAVALATRGMETFPSLSEPARVATGVYASLERWSDALAAAQQWRQRSLDRPLPADVAIAHAYLRLERATEAIAQLQPYLEAAKRAPDEYRGVLEQCARALASAGRGQEAAQLLTPLLSKGAAWRQMWMVVASSGSLDAQTGSAWLQQVAGLVPADDYTEMIALAKAWFELAIHRGDKQGYGKAREIAGRFVDRVDNVEPLVMVASASEAMDDLAGAEAAYRRILQSRPQLPTVQNNLAMVLVRLGGAERLAVAKTLADQAVEAARKANDPRILVAYLDTRARVQMQSGQRAAAIQDFQEAIKIQPNYIDALIGLASALIQDNQRDQAKPLLDRVDTLVPKPQTLSPALRRELEAARQAMDAAS